MAEAEKAQVVPPAAAAAADAASLPPPPPPVAEAFAPATAVAADSAATADPAAAVPPTDAAPQAVAAEAGALAAAPTAGGDGAVADPAAVAAAAAAAAGSPVPAAAALPAAPEPPKELEEDAPDDKRPKLKATATFLPPDTSLNVLSSVHGNVLMALTDGGLQYFLAGARSNIGLTSGRYMFEVKIVEILNPAEVRGQHGRTWTPRQLLRIGFAAANSSLFLGDTEDSLCFDSEGNFTHNKQNMMVAQKFAREQVMAVVLNLEEDGPNANTVSLFRDGVRMCQPQKLPESMRGKALFPAVTFRNLTVHVNLGTTPMAKMPFTCRMVQDAAEKDASVKTIAKPKDGKYEVLFPACLPDEGTFDWLDLFLEKHPEYTELSDRMILDWAEKSGVYRAKGYQWKTSNDKPDMGFGIPPIDDLTVCHMIKTIAPVLERNLVVMEVKGNLTKEDRQSLLKRFSLPHLKKIALIMVGDPTQDFKQRVQSIVLKEKQAASDVAFKAQQAEERVKRMAAKRQRDIEKEQRRQERAAKRLKREQEEAAKKVEEEAKKAAENGSGKEGEDKKEGEQKTTEHVSMASEEKKVEDEEDEEKEEEDDKMEDLEEQKPPVAQLTDEEKKRFFRTMPVPDLATLTLSQNFTKFTIPAREEGFDEVRYEWSKKSKVAEYVKDWVLNKKLTTRIEDLVPSDSFNQHWIQWQQQLQKWRLKQSEWKEKVKQAAMRKEQKKVAAEAEKLKVAQEKERAEKEKAEKEKEGIAAIDGEKPDENMEGKKDGEKQEDGAQKPDEQKAEEKAEEEEDDEPEQMEVDGDFDVFGVADVCDMGKGRPLFAEFTFEDWALMSLRFELHTLAHAFQQDVNDTERAGVHMDHLLFYYNKYFRKNLNTKYFGVDSFEDLIEFVSESAKFNPKNKVLESNLAGDLDSFDIFVKLTEECRRERNLLIDSGKEEVALKFSHALAAPVPAMGSAGYGGQQQSRSYQKGPRVQQAPHQQKGWHGAAAQQVQQVQYKGGAAPAHGYSGGAAAYNPGKGGAPSKGGSYGGYGGKGAPAGSKGYGGPQSQAYSKGRQYGGYNKGYGK